MCIILSIDYNNIKIQRQCFSKVAIFKPEQVLSCCHHCLIPFGHIMNNLLLRKIPVGYGYLRILLFSTPFRSIYNGSALMPLACLGIITRVSIW